MSAALSGKVAAFFDLDGTLLSTSSALLYVKYLRRRPKGPTPFDRMPFSALLKAFWYQVLYNANRIDVERVITMATLPLRGHPESRMVELCTQWFRDAVERCIRPEMPRLLDAHRDAGHRVCLLTASTPYVAVPLCERLGIQDWIASRLEVVDGVFTGQPVKPVCFGAGKIHWAGQWALEHGIDLSRSFFYTDSMTDLPMLEAVGRPVLVNPDRKLRREGARRGWPVYDFDGVRDFTLPEPLQDRPARVSGSARAS